MDPEQKRKWAEKLSKAKKDKASQTDASNPDMNMIKKKFLDEVGEEDTAAEEIDLSPDPEIEDDIEVEETRRKKGDDQSDDTLPVKDLTIKSKKDGPGKPPVGFRG